VGPARAHAAEVAPPSDTPTHEPAAPALPAAAEDREVAIHGAAVSQPIHAEAPVALAPAPEAAPIEAPAAPPPEPPQPAPAATPAAEAAPVEAPAPVVLAAPAEPAPQIQGTDGDDVLV